MGFDAANLLAGTYCLGEISKDVEGKVTVGRVTRKTCRNPGCEPLVLVQQLELTLRSAACDGKLGALLDGGLQVKNLTTVFTGPGESLRGMHAADLVWQPLAGGHV